MTYNEFYDLLFKYKMITPIWKYELDLIKNEIKNEDEDLLILFSIYFSLICSGNVCMSLNENKLMNKWFNELNSSYILFSEKENIDELHNDFESLKNTSINSFKKLNLINNSKVIKPLKYFIIDNGYLYLRKYYNARIGIINKIKDLYSYEYQNTPLFKVDDIVEELNPKFELSTNQQKAVDIGLNHNIVLTGGPGTGKTTSILFILLGILANNPNYNIYLAAASGKASSRMKEAILNNLNIIDVNKLNKYTNNDILGLIKGTVSNDNTVEEFTIHRLLGVSNNGFKYNRNNQFPKNSIFVIDEASMIDICLFNSLLDAIPLGARIFILGDKDQLPSVEVGAVFGDLINYPNIDVIMLDESKRFKESTDIYKLARKVNLGETLENIDFKDADEFKIEPLNKERCPLYYYLNDGNNQKDKIECILNKWQKEFFENIQKDSTDIDLDSDLNELFKYTDKSKILCAENSGVRGVVSINNYLKKLIIDKTIGPNLSNNYPGQVMMINKNNKALQLYNGDMGMLISIKDDDTIYFMVKKNVTLVNKDGYKKDVIFKIGDFVFYPFRLISLSDIDLAYAITIHKSQGSDYDNILVILPIIKGHPLLNRQILYTAITRTKGNTYILSNKDAINEAIKTRLIRDTFICEVKK